MCAPLLTALQVASSVGGFIAQQQAANEQERANQQNYQNQMTAYRYNIANANANKVQEAENLAAKKIENNAEVMRKQATAKVAAGEAGVSGFSVDALLAELGGRGGQANSSAETNYLRADRAIEADKMNIWAGTASSIGQMRTPQAPDFLGAALKIGDTVNTYDPTIFQRGTRSAGPTGNPSSLPSTYWK
jgi:hypothetical protein